MSAYELAGRLLEKKLYLIQEGVNSSYLEDAANMLRQQAKEKELLQNQSSELAKEVMYFQEQNRQQADRIADLEKEADRLSNHADELRKIHADRMAELEKQLAFMEGEYPEPTIVEKMKEFQEQSEPVAWVYETKNVDGKPYLTNPSLTPLFGLVTRYGYKEIPLYTTPHHASDVKQTKPLSDEANIEDYKVALDDVKRLTRELDVALNGDGAAQQASLCDIVCQVKSSKWKLVQTKPLNDEEIEPIAEMMADMYNQMNLQWKNSRGYSEQCDIMKAIFTAVEAKVKGQ